MIFIVVKFEVKDEYAERYGPYPAGATWVPARLGGSAPTLEQATALDEAGMERVVQAFGDVVFHTVIKRTIKFPETTVAGEPITTYAPKSPAADAYRDLAKEVLTRCQTAA